jgi:hypothetical protein
MEAALAPGTTAASLLTGLLVICRLDALETLAVPMKGPRFTIPTPALLTKGNINESMLGKPATAGSNGHFRTPRPIIELLFMALWAYRQRKDSERQRECTAQSFWVPKEEIASQGDALSLNRAMQMVHEEVERRPPLEILA